MNIKEILSDLNSSSTNDFNWEGLWHPPITNYLDMRDISFLHNIASSTRYSAKIKEKYAAIDGLLKARGFTKFAGGTNRVIYKFYEDESFLIKVAIDKVGLSDNHQEYKTQHILKPYVTKMFDVSHCGTVGLCERVQPIISLAEFYSVADYIFDTVVYKFIGKYVVDDIGVDYFLNWGLRIGFGPVLLDYPYVYKLDSKKLVCKLVDLNTGSICNGKIDYDAGFNNLVCANCGKPYLARELELQESTKLSYEEDDEIMKVSIINPDGTRITPGRSSDYINTPAKTSSVKSHNSTLKVRLVTEVVDEEHVNEFKLVEAQRDNLVRSNFIPQNDMSDIETKLDNISKSIDLEIEPLYPTEEDEEIEDFRFKTRSPKAAKFNKNIENF